MTEPELDRDVERMHRPLLREPADPGEGRERAPWWLWAAVAVALFWGGWYLGRFGGTFDASTRLAYGELREEVVEADMVAPADPVARGQTLYTRHCESCHQASGQGVTGTFPPVVASEWVTESTDVLLRILLQGLEGPIEVAGSTYDGAMPGWGDVLDDQEIAAVATYVRQMESNEASPVEPAEVAEVRQATADRTQPWTADALVSAVGAP